jgi:hypothetical protein
MRLTEATLKRIINEEYEMLMMENQLFAGMQPLKPEDLAQKDQDIEEAAGAMAAVSLGATVVGGLLSAPKALKLLAKMLNNLSNIPGVGKYFKSKSPDKKTAVQKIAKFFDVAGDKWHAFLVKGVIKYILKPVDDLNPPEKRMDEAKLKELANGLIMCMVVACATVGVATITGHLLSGNFGAIMDIVETVLVTVKSIEIGEWGKLIPAALAFVKTAHAHH